MDQRRLGSRAALGAALFAAAACAGSVSSKPGAPASFADMTFVAETLTERFVSEGVAVADVNRDGRLDVMAGSVWFEAPHWRVHTIGQRMTYPVEGYSDSFLNFAHDVDGDGWVDQIRIAIPGEGAVWYRNPGRFGSWRGEPIHPAVGNEAPLWEDFDGDGAPELLFGDAQIGQLALLRPVVDAGRVEWRSTPLRTSGADDPSLQFLNGAYRYSHGLGRADLDGDGLRDILVEGGWYRAPDAAEGTWAFQRAPFALSQDGCGQMYGHDFDGDGDMDVICTSGHNYGTFWIEQTGRSGDALTWRRRLITDDVSQQHSLVMTDLDANGAPDFVTGKRFLAHAEGDPGDREPVVTRWYAFDRTPEGEVRWKWRDLPGGQGAGLHLHAVDMNEDGLLDIVTANKRGVYILWQQPAG